MSACVYSGTSEEAESAKTNSDVPESEMNECKLIYSVKTELRSERSQHTEPAKIWSQVYEGNLVLKKSKLVLNSLMVHSFDLDHTTVLLWSKLKNLCSIGYPGLGIVGCSIFADVRNIIKKEFRPNIRYILLKMIKSEL